MLITKGLSYDGADGTLFEEVDVSLDGAAKKRVAIVGRNGCGKTTLLKLLRGEIEPTSGSVSMSRELIAYLPQNIEFPDESKLIGEYLESKLEEEWMVYKIEMVLEEVGLNSEILLQELKTLSGGQRVRIALAELLLLEPTILMMDEPTNHLDHESIDWLKQFVKSFAGTSVFVSHDRDFINDVADQIWEINAEKKIEVYGVSYDKFLLARYERYQKRLTDFDFSQRERRELEDWLTANANHPKYKFTATVAQKKKALERMEKAIPPEPIPDPRVRMHDLEGGNEGTVVNLKIERKVFGEKELLKGFEIKIESGDRVLLKGANGSGKTTLLNIMAGVDKEFEGNLKLRDPKKIGYLRQFTQLDLESTVLDEFGSRTALDYTIRRSVLAKYLFDSEMMDTKIKHLSFGQQRRLELAILLANKPDVLFLDEPTNHLDIFMREDLESFLVEQNVAMVIISHDQYFINKIEVNRVVGVGI